MLAEEEKFDESKMKIIIDEKILNYSHLHTIYTLFTSLCKEKEYKITPSILFNIFRQLSIITNIKYEEYKIGIFHLQVDFDKDGIINFEDFVNFISTILRFTYNEIHYKKSLNLLCSLGLSTDRKLFIDLVSNLFTTIAYFLGEINSNNSRINSSLNPFTYYDFSLKFLPFYKIYCGYKNEINMNNYYNSQKKFNGFIEMLVNYTKINIITELQNLLNSQNTSEYYKGLSLFKKSIKALNYINNELLIILFNKNIFVFLTVIIKSNILNKILMIFKIINNKNNINNNGENKDIISPDVIYAFLVILRRILNLFVFLNETFSISGEKDKKCFDHFIRDKKEEFSELDIYIINNILNPLSNHYNYFYDIFGLNSKKSPSIESKIKYVMYQLILLTSKIRYEYFFYFINNTNYLDWLTNDVKENINIKNKNTINNMNYMNNMNNINNNQSEEYRIDYLTIENVVYNCINIIDTALKYENYITNDNKNLLFMKNLYLKLLLLTNNLQDLIFGNNDNFSNLLNEKNILNNYINNNEDGQIPLKSKFLCLLGLLNSFNINKNNEEGDNQKIKEFENSKFILQIYNEDFMTKYKELTVPFSFYLKSLIINNKQILSVIAGLDLINNFFDFYSANPSNNFYSFSTFLDFCEAILDYTESNTLINNSNILNSLIFIIKKIILDNSNNNRLVDDDGVKNKLVEFLSKITNINNANLNEEILNIPIIFDTIITYMFNNFYYIEDMNYLNKKGIIFNILLIDNGVNIINNILDTNSNSYEKILKQFTPKNLEDLTNLFDKISLLWDIDDQINNNNVDEEIIKNKYVFDKYKDIPKRNILIQIVLIFDKLYEYKDKFHLNSRYEEVFKYINIIDTNMRIKLRDLKVVETKYPVLVVYTQTEEESKQNSQSRFEMNIEGISYYSFLTCLKEGYKSDLDVFYIIENNNNEIQRQINTENDFELFIQEILEIYENQPNKDNFISANLSIKLKDKFPKIKRNCINCGKEFDAELEIDEKKLEELKDFSKIENVTKYKTLFDESNELCEECQKMILESIKNQIYIVNSKNKIANLTGINLSNLNLTDIPGNTTYQNILANNTIRNDILNNNNNTSVLSSSLFNRTITPRIGLNNINNNINPNNNTNLFGLNGINNISAISPMTPIRNNNINNNNSLSNNNINNTFLSTNNQNYRILNAKYFQ